MLKVITSGVDWEEERSESERSLDLWINQIKGIFGK